MKKILLILFLFYSYSFSFECQVRKLQTIIYSSSSACVSFRNSDSGKTFAELQRNIPCRYARTNLVNIYADTEGECPANDVIDPNTVQSDRSCFFNNNGDIECKLNPSNGKYDENGDLECNSGFENQNGGCYQSIDNGWFDDEGKVNCHDGFSSPNGETCVPDAPPNPCGSGYAKTGMNGLTNEPICYPDSDGNGTADILENNLPPAPDVPYSGVQIDGNGTKRWDVGGNSYELTKDGTLTTTYSDGTQSVSQVGSDYYNSGSSGGSATGGTGGSGGSGGSGSTGNTTNETNPNTNDTPVDDTPAANSCQDSSLTLQEKMLCEMNAGMKKLNSESNTENSLNNLLKDLNNTSNTNATAINTNIKETNKKLDSIKALNENQLKEQKRTNEYLVDVENSVSTSNVLLQNVVGAFTNNNSETFVNSLEGSGGLIDGFISQYTSFYNNILTQKDTLQTLISSSGYTINQGFTLTIANQEITTCPNTYTLDMTSFNIQDLSISLDFCKYSSMLKPFLYPFFLIIFSISVTLFAIKIITRLI